MTFKNQIRGILAKKQGDNFETYFRNSLDKTKFAFHRLPQSGAQFVSKFKPPQTRHIICDVLIGYKGLTALIDIKSTNDNHFIYSMIRKKPHQVPFLLKFYENGNGCRAAGFIVFFLTDKKVVFFNCIQLDAVKPRGSLVPADGLYLGPISQLPGVNNEIKYERIFE